MPIYLEKTQTNKGYRLKVEGGKTYYTSYAEIMLFAYGEIDHIKLMTWDEIEEQKDGQKVKQEVNLMMK